jgi:hypothetical protein
MRQVLFASVIAVSTVLSGCAAEIGEEGELPEILDDDAKADSLTRPTDFGTLFDATWQYGDVSPLDKIKNAAFTFKLAEGGGDVTITTRANADADETVASSVLYIYKKSSGSTWRRVAKTTDEGFATLAKTLGKGTYRAIVKTHDAKDSGGFMIRMDCEGAGCPTDESILTGSLETAYARKHGALQGSNKVEMVAASRTSERIRNQVRVAVGEDLGEEFETYEDAIAKVKGNTITRYSFIDEIGGREILAYSYEIFTMGGSVKVGAFFFDDSATPAGQIFGGEVLEWTEEATPRTCVFGREFTDTANMPGVKLVETVEVREADDITSDDLRDLLFDAVRTEGMEEEITVEWIFENIDDYGFTINTYQVEDSRNVRIYTAVEFGSGDTPIGWYYEGQSTDRVAEISDADIYGCKAWY